MLVLLLPQVGLGALSSVDVSDPFGIVIIGGATRDSNTNLDWLDLPVTQGVSIDEILAGAGPGVGWVNDGWRIASSSEVCLLFATYAGTAPTCPDGGFGVLATPEDSMAFLGFFGVTLPGPNPKTDGLFDDGSPGASGIAVIDSNGFINIVSNARPTDMPWLDAGIFLVRPVAPPGQPRIEITPQPVDLGDVDILIGDETAVFFNNTGTTDLTLISVQLFNQAGSDVFGLRQVRLPGPNLPPLFPIVIPPGDLAFPFWVTFKPTVVGPATASLTVESDDPTAPFIFVQVIGNGVDNLGNADCFGLPATITGANGGGLIIGTAHDDVIVGGDGNDLIRGRGGDDTICGGLGDDVIFGNAGNDRILGESGADTLSGGTGLDTLIGGEGADVVQGGGDDDVLEGNGDADRLFGGGGADFINGGDGDDVLIGNGGSDTLDAGAGNDVCDNTAVDIVVGCELTRK